ncbi:MAG: fibronectin type III domain-containing protein [Patescibacteria group bacterium]|jgi:hypothetical protein
MYKYIASILFAATVAVPALANTQPAAVQNVAVEKKFAHRVKLDWSDSQLDTVTGYQVRVMKQANNQLVKKVRTPESQVVVTELQPNTAYKMRIRTIASGELGDYSEPVEVTTKPVASITVTVDGSNVSWVVDGDAVNGFKVVWSKNEHPTYPTRTGDQYQYVSADTSLATLTSFDGAGTYYVRVCNYTGSGCGVYSNEVTVTLEATNEVESIVLSYVEGKKVSWVADGYSENGYKLVWSKNPHPEYPTRDGDSYTYYGADATYGYLNVTEAGTYYARVCTYVNGACGVYSNELTLDLVE